MEGPRPAVGESGFAEDAERGVGEERSVIARRLAESGEVLGPAAAHHHDLAAARADLGKCLLEASHLLAAEDSAEVADEAEHHGPRLPEAAERDRRATLVERGEGGEPGRQGIAHARRSLDMCPHAELQRITP